MMDIAKAKTYLLARSYRPDSSSGCWIWTQATDKDGYGKAFVDGQRLRAPRLAAMIWLGLETKDSRMVLHRCDFPPCVNPAHLFLGDAKANQQDCIAKGRHGKLRNSCCPSGHRLSGDNLLVCGNGARKCRQCHRDQERKRWGEKQAAVGREVVLRGERISLEAQAAKLGVHWPVGTSRQNLYYYIQKAKGK